MNLRVIENDLVPVYETDTGEKVVYGTELHEVLDVKSPYREWSARRFKDCDALEDEEYTSVEISTLVGGSPKKEHIIKLDIAKEMAMLERNEKGKQVRRYFIEIEKKYKHNLADLSPELRAIIVVDKRITNVEKKVEHLEFDIPLYACEAEELSNQVKRKGVVIMGGKNAEAYKDRTIRKLVYSDIYNQIKREFGLYDGNGRSRSYKNLKRKHFAKAQGIVEQYQAPMFLQDAIKDTNAQIRMEL